MVTSDTGLDIRVLHQAGKRAMATRDFVAAREVLQKLVSSEPRDFSAWLSLAAACRALGDLESSLDALDGALRLDPRSFVALLSRASILERQGKLRDAASAYGIALGQAPADHNLDPPTLEAVRRARNLNQRHVTELNTYITRSIDGELDRCTLPERNRLKAFVDITLGRRARYRQEPAEFYFPGLPAIEFYERDEFPWLAGLEAQTPAICQELLAVLCDQPADFVPYIAYPDTVPLDQWAELNHSNRWQAFHLIERGVQVAANAAVCPNTIAALAKVPQANLPNRSPAAMFSALQPGTRIPPHMGVANTRLVLHLPLIVPPDCGFRVGAEIRQWKVGEAWVFDDTIEHEAWNDSNQVRAILICDVWNPRISLNERLLIGKVMDSMDKFNDNDGSLPK